MATGLTMKCWGRLLKQSLDVVQHRQTLFTILTVSRQLTSQPGKPFFFLK